MKVAHIYASNCKSNSGDFLIGIAYKKYFKEVKVFKPKSSRKDSKESFIICRKIR